MTSSASLDRLLKRTPVGRERVLLELDLAHGVAEAPPTQPLEAFRARHTPVLRALVASLRRAESDERVVGLIGTLPPSALTLAQSHELRDAITSFRGTGRPTVAFSPSFGELAAATTTYHLATAFEQIWLQPSGAVGMVGFTAEPIFLRDLFDTVGIEPQFGQRHEYKSAADTFTRSSITEPNREMLERLLSSATDVLVSDVAASRRLSRDHVRTALASGPVPARDAVERGLVDHVGYRDEAYAALRDRTGGDPTLRYAHRHRARGLDTVRARARNLPQHRPVVGVVQASGPIEVGASDPQPGRSGPRVASDVLSAHLRAAGRAEHVKAVVLRVDSPGGSYVASDAIRREIQVLRESGTPVVASMASVAASGGYFISMPCDRVVANPGTLTGSIGVLAGKAVLRGALERIGVRRETLAGSPYASMMSTNLPFDDDQLALLDRWLDDVYADFTTKAAADRGMDVDDLRHVARGRVWSGADAAELGLVDEVGGLSIAVDRACELARLDRGHADVRTVPRPNPVQQLIPASSSDIPAAAVGEGPAVWQRLLPELASAWGLTHAGVLSLPPVRLPGLL